MLLTPLKAKNTEKLYTPSSYDLEQTLPEIHAMGSPFEFTDCDNSNTIQFESQLDPERPGNSAQAQAAAAAQKVRQKGDPIDRFIPNRKISKFNIAFSNAHQTIEDQVQKENKASMDENQMTISQLYKSHILGLSPSQKKQELYPFKNQNIFVYKEHISKAPLVPRQGQFFQIDENLQNYFYRNTRKIPKVPYKVLDAPALQDDFYLNLIDWSKQNILAVGLSQCVYLWSAQNSKVTKLCDLGSSDTVTSVSWEPRGQYLAIGTNTGDVQIWDSSKSKKVSVLAGHTARVGCLAWNTAVLTSGSRDKSILHRDIRSQTSTVQKLSGHKQEVCGLKWSFDEQQLASGGNDNKLYVWSANSTQPVCKFTNHMAAVKALAWSPHQHGLLVSGGGNSPSISLHPFPLSHCRIALPARRHPPHTRARTPHSPRVRCPLLWIDQTLTHPHENAMVGLIHTGTADRTIRFWNTLNNVQLNVIDTGSQVCNLMISKNVNELVSTHGYSQNQIIIWNFQDMEKIATLTGHSYRVLYLAMSPCGQTIVTGAGDETLRFWTVFPNSQKPDDI